MMLLVLALLLVACDMTPKQARREVVDLGYSYNKTSFAACAAKADSVCLDLFLLGGMDPNTVSAGYTMLEHAAGRPVAVTRLLRAGAAADGGEVSTPLIQAITAGHSDGVRLLLAAGANAGLADGTGHTPLMAAADKGDSTSARLLLTAGADPNARSRLGATPLALARGQGHAGLVDLLRQAGAVDATRPNLQALMAPATLDARAPDRFEVEFATSAGDFRVEAVRAWAPFGADRFYNLVRHGFFDEQRFFRVVRQRLVQFGLHGQPDVSARWYDATMPDDPAAQANRAGTMVFADGDGPDSRTTQIFINLTDNPDLDQAGMTPFGRIVAGLDVVAGIEAEYGQLPRQERIVKEGNDYLRLQFPRLDTIRQARLVK